MIRTWYRAWLARSAIVFVALTVVCQRAWSQESTTSLTIGQTVTLWSDVLGEGRPVLVALPESYQTRGNERFPVLYLLDGESQFQHVAGIVSFLARNDRIPGLIVVGIPNLPQTRRRDFTPPATPPLPSSGGAQHFLRFITDELMPWVDRTYRTEPFRLLVGHSFGGLFALNTLVYQPERFNAYIAVSPALGWDDRALVRQIASKWTEVPGHRSLYLTYGAQEPLTLTPAVRELLQVLEAKPVAGLRWEARFLKGDDHASTPHRTVYDGIEFVFAGWRPDSLIWSGDLTGVEAHYRASMSKYGVQGTGHPPEGVMSLTAGLLLQRGAIDRAIVISQRTVELYPTSPTAHAALGGALRSGGRLEEAAQAYGRAIDQARTSRDPAATRAIRGYQQEIEAIKLERSR